MRWKMPPIKSLVQKGFYNYGVVKTSFSKLLLDEASESNEGKNYRLHHAILWYVCSVCMFRPTHLFLCDIGDVVENPCKQLSCYLK